MASWEQFHLVTNVGLHKGVCDSPADVLQISALPCSAWRISNISSTFQYEPLLDRQTPLHKKASCKRRVHC